MKIKFSLIIFFAVLNFPLSAQRYSPFKAGITVGVNRTQVDGDKQSGYNKTGVNFGLRAGVVFNKTFEIRTELLYNFKGSRPKGEERNYEQQIKLNLHYAEVPVLAKFYIKKLPEGYYLYDFFFGLSYGRLIRSTTDPFRRSGLSDTFQLKKINSFGYKTADISFIIGASLNITPQLGVSFRHTTALNKFYQNPKPAYNTQGFLGPFRFPARDYGYFRNYFLSFNIFYDFIAPKTKITKKKQKSIKF